MKYFVKIMLVLLLSFYSIIIYADELNDEEVNRVINEEVIEDNTLGEADDVQIITEDNFENLQTEESNENDEQLNQIADDQTEPIIENDEQLNQIADDQTEPIIENENQSNEDQNNTTHTQYQMQKVKVITTKVDEEGLPLSGATLQIIDSKNNVVDQWVSDGNPRITFLSDGVYTLHEVSAPEGYELADDKTFTVKVEIPEIEAGVEFDSEPCPHYGGTPLYYVTIEGKKQEVYCINQNWEVPDENSTYDGQILNPGSIRDYTKQTVAVDAAGNKEKIDISDQELEDEDLYNKILDIIYHRYKAESIFTDLTLTEIRFLTESALKNYTNAGLTEAVIAYRKSTNTTYVPLNVEGVLYDVRSNGDIYYLRHQYRDYVYKPDAEIGQSIAEIKFGEGNSFGQMIANHWSGNGHNAKTSLEERAKIARYYELYQYLIRNEDHHPNDMNIYIYSTQSVYTGNNPNEDYAYQNLLGITGYFEEIDQQELEIVMENKYSTEKRSIPVKKIWQDKYNYENSRPKSVTVNLKANGKVKETIVLNEENGWKYTFEDLDVYYKGNKIIYTIEEVKVAKYRTKIEGNMDKGFTIINTYRKPGKNPQTSDNVYVYVSLIVLSLLGLIKSSYYYIRRN